MVTASCIGIKLFHDFLLIMLKDLVFKSRSYRRYDQGRKITDDEMRSLVELARICPSGANRQPLKFLLINDERTDDLVFPHLKWAGYLHDWDGPVEGEHPSAYIIMVLDRSISSEPFVDHGIMAQTILLGAVEMGLGGCMLLAFDREAISRGFALEDDLRPLLVIALGKPVEKVQVEEVKEGDIRYYRDQEMVHHVPKRDLGELILDR